MDIAGDNSGIVSTGDNAINIQLTAPPVRSQYRHQVERIAPLSLTDRSVELAELAAFCLAPTGGYAWWRANAWAGKSALMSTFVLNPPPGAEIVSFFVTARLAAQDDRNAFIDNVLEQLLALLGETVPPLLTASTREAHLLARLSDAAASCQARGQRLVLLVDGLDEDRGAHEHSIAALLPARLPSGLRVVVAGRPNPPIPEDVPSDHPLRDPAIVRTLAPSPMAQAIRREMERDLHRLLTGSATGQDLLGLVTASGGGLTAPDLAEITGLLPWQVKDCIGTVTGRSFSFRDPYFTPEGPAAYLLGHEELQVTAMELLGPSRLAAYRSRIRAWANGYCSLRWPPETPEYLLRGYFRMLAAAQDTAGMLSCVTDIHRQDRLLALSGADADALTEIRTLRNRLASSAAPDLVALTKLAIHRDRLYDRNANIPVELPQAWAALGRFDRAESMARTLAEFHDRVIALSQVAEKLFAAGYRARALTLLSEAEETARFITNSFMQTEALTALVAALVAVGDADRAETMVDAIVDPVARVIGRRTLVESSGAAGDLDRAEAWCESMVSIETEHTLLHQAEAWISLIPVTAAAGDADRLDRLVARVTALVDAHAWEDKENELQVLTSLITALAAAGATGCIAELMRDVEVVAEEIRREGGHPVLLYSEAAGVLVAAHVAAGDPERAAAVAGSMGVQSEKARALAAVARGFAVAGDIGRSLRVLNDAGQAAGEIADDHALMHVAGGFAELGDVRATTRTALSIVDKKTSAAALGRLVMVLAAAGRGELAMQVMTQAEETALDGVGLTTIGHDLALAASVLARAGDVDRARQFIDRADGIVHGMGTEPHEPTVKALTTAAALCGDLDRAERISSQAAGVRKAVDALVGAADGVADAGQGERAIEILDRAVRLVDATSGTQSHEDAMSEVLDQYAKMGQFDRVEALARPERDDEARSHLLSFAATVAVDATDPDHAAGFIPPIARFHKSATTPVTKDMALAALVSAVALAGDVELAEVLFDRVRGGQDNAVIGLARGYAALGALGRAMKLAESCEDHDSRVHAQERVACDAAAAGHIEGAVAIARSLGPPLPQAKALQRITFAVVKAGDLDRAEEVARMIVDQRMRAEALLTVIRARPGVDARAVAEVLTLSTWYVALPEVVATGPGAFEEILAELDSAYPAKFDEGAQRV